MFFFALFLGMIVGAYIGVIALAMVAMAGERP